MPFINAKLNLPVSEAGQQALKAAFGQAISRLPGKSEQWLMVSLEPEAKLWFQGSDAPAAMVQVTVYGSCRPEDYAALTGELTAILTRELSIPAGRVYVSYQETPNWGFNGSNF